jgi:hypothetical protein
MAIGMWKKLLFTALLIGGVGGWGDLVTLFKKGAYNQICKYRWTYINRFRGSDERLLSLVAYSCLKLGQITPALDVAKNLYRTPGGRQNGVYITTLFLMKQLLLQVINDNLTLENVKLPIIKGELLGEVFQRVQKGLYQKEGNMLVIDNGIYQVEATFDGNILIRKYDDDGNLLEKELYW